MKTFRYSATICIGFVLFLSACMKKTEELPPSSIAPVDPVNDLVAATDPVKHILLVVPDQKDAVLKYLDAKPVAGGEMYQIQAVDFMRNRIPFTFRIQPASTNQILMQTADNKRKANLFFAKYDDDKANRDTARGQFIGKLDTGGVCYRMYKNAKCVQVSKGWETDCIEETRENPDSTFSKTGRSLKVKGYDVSHCLKGGSMCVETLSVMDVTTYYDNNHCGGAPIFIQTGDMEYNCAE